MPTPSLKQEHRSQIGVLTSALALIVMLTIVIGQTVSSNLALLFLTGTLLGLSLYRSSFGFTYAFRMLLTERRSDGVRAQLIMLGLASLLFFPVLASGTLFGRTVFGNVAPIGISVIFGAFIFGIGMQLGGGCASGTLFSVGGGYLRSLVTLAFFVVGSVIGTAHFATWQSLPSLPPTSTITLFGWPVALALNIGIFAGLWIIVITMERAKHGTLLSISKIDEVSDERKLSQILLHGPWPLLFGAVALALLNFLTLYLSGKPWGVSGAYSLWGAKLLQAAGIAVDQWASWMAPARQQALASSIFADVTSVMNFGIILGAMMAASLARSFDFKWRIPLPHLVASVVGGIFLGYGARLAYGCNIGAFFSGVASGSLHAWLWIVCALAGNWVGLQIQPLFDLPAAGDMPFNERWIIFQERFLTNKALSILVLSILVTTLPLVLYTNVRQSAKIPVQSRGHFNTVVAGGVPLLIGARMPHGNRGQDCLKCHEIVGSNKKAAIPSPPIATNATLIHPFWGVCNKCHQSTPATNQNGVGTTVTYINTNIGKNIWGASCITITPILAQQYKLPTTSGILVNSVEKNSFANNIGLIEGDIIKEINDQAVFEMGEMLLIFADKNIGDKIKLTVIKDKRKNRNIKFNIPDEQLLTSSSPDKLGIMSTGPDLNSPMAHNFTNASYLIVYDTSNNTFFALKNPYQGTTNSEISNWVISLKVSNLIVGNVNQSDLLYLQQGGIKVFAGVFGHAADAVKLYQRGTLIAKINGQAGNQPGSMGSINKVALATDKINVLIIPVNHPHQSANISNQAESARYFIRAEVDSNKTQVITNPQMPPRDGSVFAQFLVNNGGDAIIANQLSSDTTLELKNLNVAIYPNIDMSAEDAIHDFLENKLRPL
ncbi:MAG: YeeE/YedE family protein [Oligoflexia bacterium]|nr:YeeE/YedE family protein [Oligoflexia bacterium]